MHAVEWGFNLPWRERIAAAVFVPVSAAGLSPQLPGHAPAAWPMPQLQRLLLGFTPGTSYLAQLLCLQLVFLCSFSVAWPVVFINYLTGGRQTVWCCYC